MSQLRHLMNRYILVIAGDCAGDNDTPGVVVKDDEDSGGG